MAVFDVIAQTPRAQLPIEDPVIGAFDRGVPLEDQADGGSGSKPVDQCHQAVLASQCFPLHDRFDDADAHSEPGESGQDGAASRVALLGEVQAALPREDERSQFGPVRREVLSGDLCRRQDVVTALALIDEQCRLAGGC
ncbi:hypothetical protein HRK28_18530 [Rathayibacter sp. VKM Ac-2835]|uniref:hypothetical protein n=1 Tax=Rathayibacter sp. VKM Ac-2835 TaxID=2739043 RepID=UPI00156351C6|nr:hypothetical protein [Rathayibacter sp. VKM Ac-2835]NRG42911.1 hypothetical protein [Rathayibacter sp. VKM Ac-2835]